MLFGKEDEGKHLAGNPGKWEQSITLNPLFIVIRIELQIE